MFYSAKSGVDAIAEAALHGLKFVIYEFDLDVLLECVKRGIFKNLRYAHDYMIASDIPELVGKGLDCEGVFLGPVVPFETLNKYEFDSAVVLDKVNPFQTCGKILSLSRIPHDKIYCSSVQQRFNKADEPLLTAPVSDYSLEEEMLDTISDLDKRPDFPIAEIQKKVAIISTPRCGSSLFCDVLHKTGKVGYPNEWISKFVTAHYAKYFGLDEGNIDFRWYLDFIFRKTTSSNGVFSINFHVLQYQHMLELNKVDLFDLNFDKCYYLFRKEKIDQAYSHAKAAITDQWSSHIKPSKGVQGAMDGEMVLVMLTNLMRMDKYYYLNIKPRVDREFFYEDFSALNTTKAFNTVLFDLSIKDCESVWETSFKRQTNSKDVSELSDFKKYLSPSAVW